jgi:hypothetical protein
MIGFGSGQQSVKFGDGDGTNAGCNLAGDGWWKGAWRCWYTDGLLDRWKTKVSDTFSFA